MAGASAQRGIALVVALILLVVITLVGLAAVSGTLMQQKMSANFYDRDVAFQAAEAAMRQAQVAISGATAAAAAPAGYYDCSPPAPNGTGANQPCQSNPFNDPNIPQATNVVQVTQTAYIAGPMAASQPQYIVQYMGKFPLPVAPVRDLSAGGKGYAERKAPTLADFYRITARSGPANANGRASVTLQSVFRN